MQNYFYTLVIFFNFMHLRAARVCSFTSFLKLLLCFFLPIHGRVQFRTVVARFSSSSKDIVVIFVYKSVFNNFLDSFDFLEIMKVRQDILYILSK